MEDPKKSDITGSVYGFWDSETLGSEVSHIVLEIPIEERLAVFSDIVGSVHVSGLRSESWVSQQRHCCYFEQGISLLSMHYRKF